MKRILAGLLSCALALAQAAWMPALSAAATDQTAPAYTWSLKDGTAAVTNSDDGSQLIFRDVYHAEEQSGALTLYFIKEARYEPKANYLSIYVQESDLGGPVGKFALYTADPETGTLLQPTGEILSLVELKKQGLYYREEGYLPEVGWKVLPPEAGAIIPAASGFTEDNLCFSFSNESLTSNSWPQNTVSLQVCIVDSPDSMLLARKTGILPTENGQWEHYSNGKWRFMTSEGFYADRWKKSAANGTILSPTARGTG